MVTLGVYSSYWVLIVFLHIKHFFTRMIFKELLGILDQKGETLDELWAPDVYITPPEPSILTNEDSGEDDEGKSPNANTVYTEEYGKAATPLIKMLNDLQKEKKNLPYSIYFDNLFTGFNLLVTLRQHSYGETGTIQDNCIQKSCPISKSSMSKTQGDYKSQ